MAITKGAPTITTVNLTPTATNYNANLPAYAADDFWLMVIQSRAITTFPTPAGWTLLGNIRVTTSSPGPNLTVFYRIPDGSEGSSTTMPVANTGSVISTVVYPIQGVDLAHPIDSNISNINGGNTTSTTLTNPGIVVNNNGSLGFYIQCANSGSIDIQFTTPTGWTSDLEHDYRENDLSISTRSFATYGTSGAVTSTVDTVTYWCTMMFALKDISSSNAPPVVSVGNDLTAATDTSPTLTCTATDDEPLTYAWTKTSGPVGGIFTSPTSATTQVTTLVPGTYVFRCTATDARGGSAYDELTLTATEPQYMAGYVRVGAIWERRRVYQRKNGGWV